MLGAAGCIAPEILASAGAIPQSPSEVLWFKSGVIPPAGTYERGYWADPFSLFWLEVVAMQFAELKRWQDYRHPGSQGKQYFLGMENAFNGSGDPAYPGGPWFNMFNLGKTEADMKVLKTKEVRESFGLWSFFVCGVFSFSFFFSFSSFFQEKKKNFFFRFSGAPLLLPRGCSATPSMRFLPGFSPCPVKRLLTQKKLGSFSPLSLLPPCPKTRKQKTAQERQAGDARHLRLRRPGHPDRRGPVAEPQGPPLQPRRQQPRASRLFVFGTEKRVSRSVGPLSAPSTSFSDASPFLSFFNPLFHRRSPTWARSAA